MTVDFVRRSLRAAESVMDRLNQLSEIENAVSRSRGGADLADARWLGAMIVRVAALHPGQRLSRTVQEMTGLLRGEAGLALVEDEGRGDRRWHHDSLDLERCPGLAAALEGSEVVELPLAGGGRGLLQAPGRLTAVPLGAGFHPCGWVLVRGPEDRAPDVVIGATARLAGSIAAALIWPDRVPGWRVGPGAAEGQAGRAGPHRTPAWGIRALPADEPRKVVVVEDDPDVAFALQASLESEGYQVEVTTTADQALATVQRRPPSLVILDVSLPDGNGFSVAKAMAAHRRTAQVPVLFLSAVEDLASQVRSLHRDEADFLQKPFDWNELLTRVEQSILRAEHRDQLLCSARTDVLTGLGNRRFLEEHLGTEAARLDRYGTPLSLAILDVDGLKTVNDRHGHAAGSALLRAVGEALQHTVRETDLAARYGGDEFVVVLPHTDLDHAGGFAERLLARLRTLRPCGLPVSVSIGVAAFDGRLDATVEDLFKRADGAAYRAKREGGNRVHLDRPAS
jgi:two-component system, cell cycle response regulator